MLASASLEAVSRSYFSFLNLLLFVLFHISPLCGPRDLGEGLCIGGGTGAEEEMWVQRKRGGCIGRGVGA